MNSFFNSDILTLHFGQTALLTLGLLFAAANANAIAGGRLQAKPKSPVEIAAKYFKKGEKARNKALAFEADAAASNNSKTKFSQVSKAEKQHRRAIGYYKRAVKLAPTLANLRTNLAYSLLKTGHYTDALSNLDEALRVNEHNQRATTYRNEVLIALKQHGVESD